MDEKLPFSGASSIGRNRYRLVAFLLNEQRYALFLSAVERIVRAVEVTALPKAPEIVLGVVNMRGQIIPVINVRKRFHLPGKEIDLSDQFLIAHTSTRIVGLAVDAVLGVIERAAEEVISVQKIVPGIEYVVGIVRLQDGMILIHDLDKFLSLDEERVLNEAMA